MASVAPSFGVVDYIVFIGMFVVSIGIGIYFGIVGRRTQTNEQYLMGNRKLSLIPVALSITVSVVSSNTLLGSPAEMYNNGIMYVFVGIPYFLATFITAAFFVPLIYPLNVISINEYLERRFSKIVRYLGCLLFLLNSSLYVGTVIFGPATALNIATGAPPYIAILIVGVIGTAYTTIGGMKAVVWTDAFQSFVMVAGLIAVCILGAIKVGGMSEVISINNDWGRFEMQPGLDLTSRYGFLVLLVGYTNYWVAGYGVNQPCSQRYCAMETIKKSKIVMLLNGPGCFLINSLAMLTGSVAFAYYTSKGCDPIRAKMVSNANQIIPYFVMEVLAYPGLPGIFISCLFSASLSTVSSSINSMAAVTSEDMFKERFRKMRPDRQATLTKVMVVIYGMVCMAVAFLVLSVGGNLMQISISFFGSTIGPTLGLFVLGALVPWANWKGALVGGLTSISLSLWIMFGQVFAKLQRTTLPSPVHNCWNTTGIHSVSTTSIIENIETTTYLESTILDSDVESEGFLHSLYSIAFTWFAFFGTVIVVLIGLVVSLLTGGNDTENMDSSLLFVCLRKRYGKSQVLENERLTFSNDLPKEKLGNGDKSETHHLMDVTKT